MAWSSLGMVVACSFEGCGQGPLREAMRWGGRPQLTRSQRQAGGHHVEGHMSCLDALLHPLFLPLLLHGHHRHSSIQKNKNGAKKE
jgi:hypothetical protein